MQTSTSKVVADPGIKAHAHMLRHACGYKLANDGHDTRAIQAYLGHRNIQHTVRVTPSWRRRGSRTSGESTMVALPQMFVIEPCQYLVQARLSVERHIVISHAELIAQPLRDGEMPAM
jgi:hypothetical protein